jgi:hypothetical protein
VGEEAAEKPPPETPCTCPVAGWCPRFNMDQTGRPWEICQGLAGEEIGFKYRRKWSGAKPDIASVPPWAGPRATPGETPEAPKPRSAPTPLPEKGIVVRVVRAGCRGKAQPWCWVVALDGVVQESGSEVTEGEARAKADAAARELAEELGLSWPQSDAGPATNTSPPASIFHGGGAPG